jgi:hypothetical protein
VAAGSRRSAKRYIVTARLEILDHALAKKLGAEGTYFQSGAEAKRWVALNFLQRAGQVRGLRRQHECVFWLHAVGPDGLKRRIGRYIADHCYDEKVAIGPDDPRFATNGPFAWEPVVEDVKPAGGDREDVYVWKKRHVEAEYGITVREFTGR